MHRHTLRELIGVYVYTMIGRYEWKQCSDLIYPVSNLIPMNTFRFPKETLPFKLVIYNIKLSPAHNIVASLCYWNILWEHFI